MGGRHNESIFGTIPPYLEGQRKALIKAKSTGFRTKILNVTSQIRCRIYLLPTAEGPPVCLMTKGYCDHTVHLQVLSVQS
jgi:hypothetical protein